MDELNSRKLTLYHISRDFKETIQEFVPRVPTSRASDENNSIPRICTSPSLEGCMIAHPNLWYHAAIYPDQDYADPYEMMERLTILLDHDEKTGFLMKAYEFHVCEEIVVKPHELFSKELVSDALETNEHWITKNITPSRTFYLFLHSAERKEKKHVFDFTCFEEHTLGDIENCLDRWSREREEENKKYYQTMESETLNNETIKNHILGDSDEEIPF